MTGDDYGGRWKILLVIRNRGPFPLSSSIVYHLSLPTGIHGPDVCLSRYEIILPILLNNCTQNLNKISANWPNQCVPEMLPPRSQRQAQPCAARVPQLRRDALLPSGIVALQFGNAVIKGLACWLYPSGPQSWTPNEKYEPNRLNGTFSRLNTMIYAPMLKLL